MGLLVRDLDHLVLGHAGGADGAEGLVIEQRESSAGGVASAGVAPTAGLDVLYVLPVVLGDGGAPVADGSQMGADLRVGLQAVGLVSRQSDSRRRDIQGGSPAIQNRGQRLCVGEGVVDARLVAVGEVVGAPVEQAVVGARRHQLQVP